MLTDPIVSTLADTLRVSLRYGNSQSLLSWPPYFRQWVTCNTAQVEFDTVVLAGPYQPKSGDHKRELKQILTKKGALIHLYMSLAITADGISYIPLPERPETKSFPS